jgi:hypothetical protein
MKEYAVFLSLSCLQNPEDVAEHLYALFRWLVFVADFLNLRAEPRHSSKLPLCLPAKTHTQRYREAYLVRTDLFYLI